MKKLPLKLYKYRAFNVNTLHLLTDATLFYANPTSFNDPLDCNPTIEIDISREEVEKLCYKMLLPKVGKKCAIAEINNHRYMSTEYGDYKIEPDVERYYIQSLGQHIKNLLRDEAGHYSVLSLATHWDCPLMWSHYADEHRGVCIEYSTANHACDAINPVQYNTSRSIKASDLVDWKINGSPTAKNRIFNTYFLAKSPQWRYEREWRDISKRSGEQPAPFNVSAIYFGLKCDGAVQTTIVKLFSNPSLPIKFYDIYPLDNSFKLKRQKSDTGYIEACGVQTTTAFDFKDIFVNVEN